MGLFNKNDNDDRESLFRQALHGASYSDTDEDVRLEWQSLSEGE